METALDETRKTMRSWALSSKDFDQTIEIAKFLGKLNWLNNDYKASDPEFESQIFEKYNPFIEETYELARKAQGDRARYLHIVSQAHSFGGHTALLISLLDHLDVGKSSQAVAITEHLNDQVRKRIDGHQIEDLSNFRSAKLKFEALAGCVSRSETIVLHIHPDDILAAIAALLALKKGKKVLFINHADHVFSFGTNCSSTLLEVSRFGWEFSEKYRRFRSHSFLGIPVFQEQMAGDQSRTGPVLSVGRPSKFAPDKRLDFSQFLSQLLERVPNDAVIVGPSGKEPWWQDVLIRYPGRVFFPGIVSSGELNSFFSKASCYVDSFPINGGTTLAQALCAGLNVFVPSGNSGGYNLAENLKSSSLDDMVCEIENFIKTGKLKTDQEGIRRGVKNAFSCQAVARRLRAAEEGANCPLPLQLQLDDGYFNQHRDRWLSEGRLRFPDSELTEFSVISRAWLLVFFVFRTRGRIRFPRTIWMLSWLLFGASLRRKLGTEALRGNKLFRNSGICAPNR
ncbi:MAG: hypothetical protein AAGB04_02355 [Pseudomonadota bacterium]